MPTLYKDPCRVPSRTSGLPVCTAEVCTSEFGVPSLLVLRYTGAHIKAILGLYKGYIGRMEKKLESTIMGYIPYLWGANPRAQPSVKLTVVG